MPSFSFDTTTFQSRFPGQPAPASTSSASPSTVLVVDDEEINRDLLRDPLEARGFRVLEAANGPEALQIVSSQPPDVVLLDLMMPGMDGFEVCRRLKADPALAAAPVLILTALSERRERLLGIEAGANDFITKPIDVPDLLLRVRNAAYAKDLFEQLKLEREKSERLLQNVLPASIAQRIKAGEPGIADHFPEATVLVSDLAGFSFLASHISPRQLVFLLNEVFSAFDLLAETHGLEKIKTIGDAYMVAGGVPDPRPDHALAIARLALAMMRKLHHFNFEYQTSLHMRIGICTGPLVAGVIGRKKFSYDIWGDTVNIACRLESIGLPGSILVNETAFERLKDHYRFGPRATQNLKGRGHVDSYQLLDDPVP